MAKCNQLTPLPFKGLIHVAFYESTLDIELFSVFRCPAVTGLPLLPSSPIRPIRDELYIEQSLAVVVLVSATV